MRPPRLRDLIEAHIQSLTPTASSRETSLLAAALKECLRRAVERDRLAEDLAAKDAETQRLRAAVRQLDARVEELEADPAADVTLRGAAPPGWSLAYNRKRRWATITRPDGIQIGLEVYPRFWPEERT
jgi:hypothetical protein